MNTPTSPENEEVTPSKKKLKQARLPFKIISDVSPKPDTPPSRKRKLSASEPAPVTKIGKVTKENVVTETLVISDDDSKDELNVQKEEKPVNPYVKLVDAARKKKQQQKSKSSKKKKGSKNLIPKNSSANSTENAAETTDKDTRNVEEMEVDSEEVAETSKVSDTEVNTDQNKSKENGEVKGTDKVLILEDSNQEPEQAEIKKMETETNITSNEESSNKTENKENNLDKDDNTSDSDSEERDIPEESGSKVESISVTPKRSTRNDKEKSKLNISQLSTGDESISSDPSTPRRSMRSSSVSKSKDDASLNESNTNLTPKQLQKKLESAKKKEEREKEKQDKDKKRQQEKEERAKQKQEKEEQRKREKEEKEELKRKEKEEKERQKELEKKQREEKEEQKRKEREEKEEQRKKEKEEKEEQKRKEKEAREEEKRKKQEALELEKLEQEQKKKKAAEAFVNFFVPKQKTDKDQISTDTVSKSSVLSSFAIKSDMRLAPIVRGNLTEEKRQTLDDALKAQNVPEKSLYVKSLKSGENKPLSSGKTWPLTDKDDDVMIIEDELPPMDGAGEILSCDSAVREKLRPKLFSFHENRRPPYWGTWRKKSTHINPRRPFQQDQKHLDYDVDSDDDWEEEQEGESIDGSAAGSDDEQDADEYEVDNEVFVPHGYLSDEEATMDEEDVLSLSPETQKARLKHLEDEFELEHKKPTEKLKPRLYGLLWENSDGSKPEKCVDALWNYFGKLAMIMNDPTPLLQPSSEPEEGEKKKVKKKKSLPDTEHQSPKNDKKKAKQDNKDNKKPKSDPKKNTPEVKKNQLGINTFLTKIKS